MLLVIHVDTYCRPPLSKQRGKLDMLLEVLPAGEFF